MPLNYSQGGTVTPTPEPKAIEATPKAERVLSLENRCDACFHAAAFVRAYFISGLELDFCSHHWNLYYSTIKDDLVDFVDEREYINAKLDVSA